MTVPADEGLRQPAEWSPHRACWVAWPAAAELWQENLAPAQREFTALCRAIAGEDPGRPAEALEVLVPDAEQEQAARTALGKLPVRFHRIPYGDIWLRDTAPIFLQGAKGRTAAARFGFNGWGGKYVLEHDDRVADRIAEASGLPSYRAPFVLEGGSVEVDGEGTVLTTRQCLLNPNRNPSLSADALEAELRRSLGATKVLWLEEGLLNDHTDGHIDTVARFVAPGRVVCMRPSGKDDPNAQVLDTLARDLERLVDAQGRRLEVVRVPSPGKILNPEGQVMPASTVNFYIGNQAVAVPTYGVPHDEEAVRAIAALFPSRKTVGLSARAILSGGGAFHCITQQEPLPQGKRS